MSIPMTIFREQLLMRGWQPDRKQILAVITEWQERKIAREIGSMLQSRNAQFGSWNTRLHGWY